ncbi:DUF11 domain-containing protein [Flindersiella endophytica]
MGSSRAAVTALLCTVFVLAGAGAAGAQCVADLRIDHAAPAQAAAGDTFDYVLTVRNAGPGDAVGTVVRDVLDARVRYVRSDPACTFASDEVVCALGTLTPDQSRRIVVTVRTAATLADGTTLRSYAVVCSLAFDDNRGDNGASGEVRIRGPADLGIRLSGPEELRPGEQGTYTLDVGNRGLPASSVVVRARLDPVVRIDGVPRGCTLDAVRNQLECARAAFGRDERWAISLTARANPAAPPRATARATAVVWSAGRDADETDNSDSWTTRVRLPSGDLGVEATGPRRISPGTPYAFRVTAANRGPDVVDARLRGELAAGLRVARLPAECTSKGRVVSCEVAELGVEERRELEVGVLPSPGLRAESRPRSEFTLTPVRALDPDRSGNVAGFAPAVPAAAPHFAVEFGDVAPRPGSRVTATVVVTNAAGAGAASDLVVFDRLPAGVSLASASAQPGEVRQERDGLLRWTIPSLASGASARLVLTMLVGADVPAGAALVNQVWAHGLPVTRTASGPVAAASPLPRSEQAPGGPTVRPSPSPSPRPTALPQSTPPTVPEPSQAAQLAVVPEVPEPTVPGDASAILALGIPMISMVVAVRMFFRK